MRVVFYIGRFGGLLVLNDVSYSSFYLDQVVTVPEKPFTWIREVDERDACVEDEIFCPRRNKSSGEMFNYNFLYIYYSVSLF